MSLFIPRFRIHFEMSGRQAKPHRQVSAFPQLRGHALDVVECDAKPQVDQLTCGKACRGLLESGEYWQRIYPESATFTHSQ